MSRTRWAALAVPLLLTITLATFGPPSAQAAVRSCVHAGSGTGDNYWQNGDGQWSDASHWSLGAAPGAGSGQYVCIPDNVAVVLDTGRVDVQAFELGRGSGLTLRPDTALYVWGGADDESLTRAGSVLKVQGASLGGPGQLHVIGTVELTSLQGSQARLTGSGDTAPAGDGSTGLMLVGDDGTLDFAGQYDGRLTGGYTVDVRGRVRTVGDAGVLADPGSRLELNPHLAGDGKVGRLVIGNGRGFFASDLTAPGTLVNNGRIVKRFSDANAAVTADYSGGGDVRIRRGYLVLPDEADGPAEVAGGASVGSGTCPAGRTCNTDTTEEDQQFASLTLPEEINAFTEVTVTPQDEKVKGGSVGVPMQVHAEGLAVTAADPVVIELRYDKTLLENAGRKANPDALIVKHSYSGTTYTPIPDCAALGAIPAGAFACVDRRSGASRKDTVGGDVVMVVRTIRTSRWIAY